MKRIIMLVSMGFTLIGLPVIAISAPTIKVNKSYYLVSGGTANIIRNDIDMKTPIRQNGNKYDAYTKWFVRWNLFWNESNGECAITTVKTTVDVKYTLPQLQTSSTLPDSLGQKWQAYMKALLDHEDGHKSFGVRAANEIENKLGGMAARSSCKQLESDANSMGEEILEKFRGIEKEFDRKTNHGMNKGAVFP